MAITKENHGKSKTILRIMPEIMGFFNYLVAQQNKIDVFIDGTLYNSVSGMNFSCAGIKTENLAIFLRSPSKTELSTAIRCYKYGTLSDGEECEKEFPEQVHFYIDESIFEDLEEEEIYQILFLILEDPNSNPPKIYAEMR
jgi:hypothetical protein